MVTGASCPPPNPLLVGHGHAHVHAARPFAPGPPPPAPSVIAVCSGKGGVGKSSIALNLATALAAEGERVGLVDADVHGPDLPLMVGLARRKPARQWMLARAGGLNRTPLEPVTVHGVKLMSTGFIVAEDQAMAWTADLVNLLLHQLLWSTTWGELDRLILDLPPGTSDLTQAVFHLLPDANALVVVTPQDSAHLDCRRLLSMLQRTGVTVLGGVENMGGLTCPCCKTVVEVFPPVSPERSIWSTGVRRLGRVPLFPAGVAGQATAGREPVVVHEPESAQAVAITEIARTVRETA
jgi:ATP-binding protein involved in chromosome partitioning